MKKFSHPSQWIDTRVVEKIRSTAAESEQLKQLHPDQLKLIHQQRWLKLFVPKKFGGLELSLPDVLKIEEALAWTDGSTAWVVTLCAGAAWFIGFLDSQLTKEIFADGSAFFAGSGAATGTAEITSDGYVLNGNWKYASGALHSNVFTANFALQYNGKPVLLNGKPEVCAFLMKRDEVTVQQTWNSMGMIATASHSFEVKNLKVPSNRCFEIDAKKAVINLPIYQYPFLQLAETTLTVNLSGLALRFIELSEELITPKKNERSLEIIRSSKSKLNELRNHFYKTVDSSWKSCARKKSISKIEVRNVSRASQALAKQSREIVDQLYPHCGLTAANTQQEINRVWRNLHTASQHSLFKN